MLVYGYRNHLRLQILWFSVEVEGAMDLANQGFRESQKTIL